MAATVRETGIPSRHRRAERPRRRACRERFAPDRRNQSRPYAREILARRHPGRRYGHDRRRRQPDSQRAGKRNGVVQAKPLAQPFGKRRSRTLVRSGRSSQQANEPRRVETGTRQEGPDMAWIRRRARRLLQTGRRVTSRGQSPPDAGGEDTQAVPGRISARPHRLLAGGNALATADVLPESSGSIHRRPAENRGRRPLGGKL